MCEGTNKQRTEELGEARRGAGRYCVLLVLVQVTAASVLGVLDHLVPVVHLQLVQFPPQFLTVLLALLLSVTSNSSDLYMLFQHNKEVILHFDNNSH